ncbi:MAG: DNA helicase I [Bacteroidetes bacterium]|nr:DNA helicase I [Bacteroidota bacterium]MBS1539376.1 DNA helicase I [Bacteroidota bacterium]
MATDKTKKLLTTFLHRLTNLSGHNRSLFLPKSSEAFVDLHGFSWLNNSKSFGVIEAMLKEGSYTLCALADARVEAVNLAGMRLKKLQRLDQFYFDERGVRDLHIGWPMVHGRFSDGTAVRCPLLFFPVELSVKNEKWIVSFRPQGEIIFNKSFLLAYSFYNQRAADEALLQHTFETEEGDATTFLTSLYRLLGNSSIELNFNPELYQNELVPLASFAKREFVETHHAGELKLFSEAVLGLFPQAGSTLVPDYNHLLEADSFADLEDFFARHQPAADMKKNFISKVGEEKKYEIFPSDIWQENALKASKLGHSLVVQGPPGTGKSQLITNLISDSIANGKRILLVCQKRVALDVVYNRLKEKNLENFLALVHDFRNDRPLLFQKIAGQINRTDEYRKKNITLDALQLDHKFYQISKRINQVTEELEHFRSALFDETECGKSIKELYLISNPAEEGIALRQLYYHFKFNELDSFRQNLRQYIFYAKLFDHDQYVLHSRNSFASLTVGDLPALHQAIDQVPAVYDEIKTNLSGTIGIALDWELLHKLSQQTQTLKELATLTQDESVFLCFKKMLPQKSTETNSLWLLNIERMMNDCFSSEGIEQSVPSAMLGHFQKALHRAMKARRGIWSWLRWQLFSKDKLLITRALVSNGLTNHKDDFRLLEKKLDQRLNLEHNLSKLRAKEWLLHLPATFQKQDFKNWFAEQQKAIRAKTVFNSIRSLKNIISPLYLSSDDFSRRLQSLIKALDQLEIKYNFWLLHLSEKQVTQLATDKNIASLYHHALHTDFDALCEFDKIQKKMSGIERAVIEKLREKTLNYDEWPSLFQNSLALGWIDHIEAKYPELRMASSGKIQQLENELQEEIIAKQALSAEILLLRARERITSDLEFNRLNNRVTYRDLLHQTTKKKKLWPLRKIVSEFEGEVFKLLPCWMASPESVSALFPMKEIFDLVIFDEASQCFAERGIPALYRGKQTVIAGDSKQLRPGDFYQARWHEDDMEEPDAEVDSLLELGERYLFSIRLNGHYRSQVPELIHFSNQYFYDGKLEMLPDLHRLNQGISAIDYLKVKGVWEDQTNIMEAAAIADLVFDFLEKQPAKEIGIVTFNAPQQTLIQDMLEEKFTTQKQLTEKNIFVKNIENVQGDERDLIIFSVGYAPDREGKIRAQFGSLNQQGGENRLNVAISRAREKIIVVASLWPEELDVADTRHAGPKLLKEYLQYARDVSTHSFKPLAAAPPSSFYSQLKKEILTSAAGRMPEKTFIENVFPFQDLTLYHNRQILLAVSTDDQRYYESLSAKADHALNPLLLQKKNWPHKKMYSRNYWANPKRFWNDLTGY